MKNWSFLRVLRLVMAVVFTVEVVDSQSWWLLGVVGLLLYQVYSNPVCGSSECSVTDKEVG